MGHPHEPLNFERLADSQQREALETFHRRIRLRRSVRHFSPEPVPLDLIKTAIRCAATAPSGANQQPWRFVVVSDPRLKR